MFAVRLVEPLRVRSVNLSLAYREPIRIATADWKQRTSLSTISIHHELELAPTTGESAGPTCRNLIRTGIAGGTCHQSVRLQSQP
jgi:hypothetical protein